LNFKDNTSDNIRTVAITNDNKYAISGATDCAIKVWDLDRKVCLHTATKAHDCTID